MENIFHIIIDNEYSSAKYILDKRPYFYRYTDSLSFSLLMQRKEIVGLFLEEI